MSKEQLNKEQVAQLVADKMSVTKKEALEHIDSLWDVVTEALVDGKTVTFVNVGKFQAKERKERQGRNPKTGAVMTIPAQKTVGFSVGKGLKDRVKGL